MDCIELLARENEFKKLNQQLENKTKSLMKEIEHVMSKPDIFSDYSPTISLQHTPIKKHACGTNTSTPLPTTPIKKATTIKNNSVPKLKLEGNCSKGEGISPNGGNYMNAVRCDTCVESKRNRLNADLEFLWAFVSLSVEEKVLPQNFLKDGATVESVCKFLSSKIKLMQEQIDKLQDTINKKASQCEVHLSNHAELESERMTLRNQNNNLKAATADMRAKYQVLLKKSEDKERMYREKRSESDKLAAEVKRLRSKAVSAEARCATQEEIIENLKHQLATLKKQDQDYKEHLRTITQAHKESIDELNNRVKATTARNNRLAALAKNRRRQIALLRAENLVDSLSIDIND